MATKESTQEKIKRNRAPRVHITYNVEVGGANQQKELPFVLGVADDYTGHSPNKTRLKDRKFIQIDRDNFDDVLRGMAPSLVMKVDNKLDEASDSKLSISLQFSSIDDFSPENVARQVEPLRKLLETRTRLANLKNKALGNDAFEEMLDGIARDPEQLRQIRKDQAAVDKTEENKE